MRIGIDLDDTLIDSYPLILKNLEKFYPIRMEECMQKGMQYRDFYDMDHNYFDYIKSFLEREMPNVQVKEHAIEVLNQWIKEDNQIIIITARNKKEYQNPQDTTEKLLRLKGIPYHELYTEVADKGSKCEELKIDLFIDDSINNCKKALSHGVRAMVFNTLFNKQDTNLKRLQNWLDAYQEVKNIKKEL